MSIWNRCINESSDKRVRECRAHLCCPWEKLHDDAYMLTTEEFRQEYAELCFDNEEFGRLQAEQSEWDTFEHVPRPKRKESATRRWITLSAGQRKMGRKARS